MRGCPSGQLELDKAGFKRIFQDSPSSDQDDFFGHIFNVFDEDKSGTIDFRELICALSAISHGPAEEKLKCTPRSTDGARPINLFS
jgi:Ca2+-binding EF-hand superfamily protein